MSPDPNPRQDCPSTEAIAAFAVGDLDADEWRRVEEHVRDCESCGCGLAEHDDQADALTRTLQRDTVPAEWIERARTLDPSRAADAVDVGARIARVVRERGEYVVDRLRLTEPLGAGSFGYVFRAVDLDTGQPVAVKIDRARGRSAAPWIRSASGARRAASRRSTTRASSPCGARARPATASATW